MVKGPTPPAKPSSSGGWLTLIVIVGSLIMIGQCTAKKDAAASSENVSMTDMNAADAVEPILTPAQQPGSVGAPQPLDAHAIARAVAQEGAVVSAQGLAGAMIFSQNCYDALGRAFSWSKLDECGGFDAAAAGQLTDDDAATFAKEAAYFDAETAAGRYLAAATGAGEEDGEEDQRWATLQAKVRPATPTAKSDAAEAEADNTGTPTAAEQVATGGAAPH